MRPSYEILKYPVTTEKGAKQSPMGKYVFRVDTTSNKAEIKSAVEEIYSVKVKKVNVMTMKGKKKRVRYVAGYSADWKKAIVTLKDGHKIEMT